MKDSQKGFLNIIIAVVVVVAIAGYVAWDNNLIPKNILSKNGAQQEVQSNTDLQNQDDATLPVQSNIANSPKPVEKIIPKTPVQSQTSSNTSTGTGWVNYSNNTLGVGLKHPSDWTAYTVDPNDARIMIMPKNSDPTSYTNYFGIVIEHEEGTPEEIIAKNNSFRDNSGLPPNITRDIKINGRTTILREMPKGIIGERGETYVVDSGFGSYLISYAVTKDNHGAELEPIAKKIITDLTFDSSILAKDPRVSKKDIALILQLGQFVGINGTASLAIYPLGSGYSQICSGNTLNLNLKDTYQHSYFDSVKGLIPYAKSCSSNSQSFAVDFTVNGRTICSSAQGVDQKKQYAGYGYVDPVNKVCVPQ